MLDAYQGKIVVRDCSADLSDISGAHYHAATNVWTLPGAMLPEVQDRTGRGLTAAAQVVAENWAAKARQRANVPDHASLAVFKTKPRAHQILAYNLCMTNPRFALFLEMGLGKTKVMVDVINNRIRREQIKKVLVVCPKSVLSIWAHELLKHGVYPEVRVSGTSAQKKRALAQTAHVYVINYDAVAALSPVITGMGFDMIVLDESTKIKSPTTQVTKALLSAAQQIRFRYILTGTPLGNNLPDFFTQIRFLSPDILDEKTYYAFAARWAIKERRGNFDKIVGYRNYEAVIRQIAPYSLRLRKSECVDLPDKIYQTRVVQMNARQEALYREIKTDLIAAIRAQTITVMHAGGAFTKLAQIAGGTVKDDDGGLVEISFAIVVG